jgi:hypothetical protein
MTDIQIAIISLVAGGILSAVVSWYFFRKSTDKRLSTYVQFASPVLGGIDDPRVREALEIRYRGTKIDDLVQLQFVVANDGQRAIRDLIEPLHLLLPKDVRLLDARVLYVQLRGREVTVSHTETKGGETRVNFEFKLLNRGEFFFVKLLLNGELDPERLRFRVTVDDLPPTITPKKQPFRTPEEAPTTGWGAVALGGMPLGLAIGSAYGMYALAAATPNLFPGVAGFVWFSWSTAALALWLTSILYWVGRSTQLIVARGLFGPRQRFHLPYSVIRADYPRLYHSEPEHFAMMEDRYRRVLLDPSLPPVERRRLLRRYERQIQVDFGLAGEDTPDQEDSE